MKRQTALLTATSTLFLCTGLLAGWYFGVNKYNASPEINVSTGQVRANLPQYKFINPPLFSESAKLNSPQFKKLTESINSYMETQKSASSIESAAVYFRDLNGGVWTGVHEDDLYTPSSMLKVVAMMATLKLAESNPSILSEKLHYVRPEDNSPYAFRAKNTVAQGDYSIQDLVGFMIKDSDNGAFDAIVSDPKINAEFSQVYSLFKLPAKGLMGSSTDFMSPRSFSTVMRVLYNSSFFSWDLSEQVLSLLSQTTFTQGLVAGVPSGTVVSHKFGENTNELHDCGIIYYPGHPYLLCVMTRGMNEKALESAIQHISQLTWDFVDQGGLSKN